MQEDGFGYDGWPLKHEPLHYLWEGDEFTVYGDGDDVLRHGMAESGLAGSFLPGMKILTGVGMPQRG